MFEFSSFMIPWNSIFYLLSGSAIVGTVCMLGLAVTAQNKFVSQEISTGTGVFWKGLVVTAALSMVLVMLLQTVANFAFEMAFAGGSSSAIMARTGAVASRNRVAIVVLVTTILVGGGYAFSMVEASLPTHIIAFIVGVGFLEEAAKALAAILIYNLFFKNKSYVKKPLSPFLIAGLGFGIGEGFHYFSTYNMYDLGLWIYLVRALWCVPLHASWTVVGGYRIYKSFGGIPVFDNLKSDDYWKLLRCLMPVMILHGFYNGFSVHDNPLSWVVGIGSIIWGGSILFKK